MSANSWEDLQGLVTNENATFEQKLAQISEIMQKFPERKFILVGDSGEKDPEVYREIKKRFSDQVQKSGFVTSSMTGRKIKVDWRV
ncbi:MAG: App1 family protein [Planctomycetia bacterium]|nr:App1 family protein [Planctomycetia bacterium]